MKTLFLTLATCLLTFSCQAPKLQFDRMSSQELADYNQTVPLYAKVHCETGYHSGSHIKKTACMTVDEWVNQAGDTASLLSVLSISTFSAFAGND